jgi:hypothetical protein
VKDLPVAAVGRSLLYMRRMVIQTELFPDVAEIALPAALYPNLKFNTMDD